MGFSLGDHGWRDSEMGTSTPIWANGAFKPARFKFIRGKTELLRGMDIIEKMDSALNVGGNQFNVGQSALAMMTFKGNRHGVFPLVPTSRAYAKSNGYFGKLRGSEIEVPQPQGDFFSGGVISSGSFTGAEETLAK